MPSMEIYSMLDYSDCKDFPYSEAQAAFLEHPPGCPGSAHNGLENLHNTCIFRSDINLQELL